MACLFLYHQHAYISSLIPFRPPYSIIQVVAEASRRFVEL